MKSIAETVVIVTLILLAATLVIAGVSDFLLWIFHEQTISSFLREHAGWYWWTLLGFFLFALLLGFHLFVEPRL